MNVLSCWPGVVDWIALDCVCGAPKEEEEEEGKEEDGGINLYFNSNKATSSFCRSNGATIVLITLVRLRSHKVLSPRFG